QRHAVDSKHSSRLTSIHEGEAPPARLAHHSHYPLALLQRDAQAIGVKEHCQCHAGGLPLRGQRKMDILRLQCLVHPLEMLHYETELRLTCWRQALLRRLC